MGRGKRDRDDECTSDALDVRNADADDGRFANSVANGKNKILLDLSGVTTIDSSGIGELVGSYTTATNRGGKLKLLHLPAKLNELLHVTQLITVFEVYENEDEAVKSF